MKTVFIFDGERMIEKPAPRDPLALLHLTPSPPIGDLGGLTFEEYRANLISSLYWRWR